MPIGTSDGRFFDSMDMMFSDLTKAPLGVGAELELPKGTLQGQVGAKKIGDVVNAVALPGDMLTGKVKPGSVQEMERATDLAGLMVGGPAPVASKLADGTLGSFAGVKSKTINKDKLYQAQNMEFDSVHPDIIHSETGFYRGSEGRWRYEISPEKSNILDAGVEFKKGSGNQTDWTSVSVDDTISVKPARMNNIVENPLADAFTPSTLGEILHHPELYKAYPHLKDMGVWPMPDRHVKEGIRGMFSPSNNGIFMSPAKTDDFHSTLLHEVQHAIQEFEGFSKGGNPESYLPKGWKEIKDQYKAARNEALRKAEEQGVSKKEIDSYLGSIQAEENGLLKNLSTDKKYASTVSSINERLAKAKELGIYDSLKNIHKSERLIQEAEAKAYSQYRNLAGEIEARNVQSRIDWTDAERSYINPRNFRD